jgi:hypothetical protein
MIGAGRIAEYAAIETSLSAGLLLKGAALDSYGTSPRLAPPPKLCGLFRKYSRLPVAASAYWSMLTMIA